MLMCFASSSPFDDTPYSRRVVHRFSYPTADVTLITKVVSELADQFFSEGVRFYKVGVGLLDLIDERQEQADLFNPTPNNSSLMSVFNGQNTVFLGVQGIEQKWQVRRQLLTPQHTHVGQIFL